MPSTGSTSKSTGRRTQKPSALQTVCTPAALSTACNPETYEGSPSPYNTTAEDDSAAVTGTGGPPPTQHMMTPAVPWDHGAAYSASPGYVGQQPGQQQQPMEYGVPGYQGFYDGTQGAGGVVNQQPHQTAPMGYGGHYGYPGGQGQPGSSQQYGYPQYDYSQQGYPQQGYSQQGYSQQGYAPQGSQQHDSQQYGRR